jgi:hypothetical protein
MEFFVVILWIGDEEIIRKGKYPKGGGNYGI